MAKEADGRRKERVEREVQGAIAQYLIKGFRIPLPGIVTVASVRMPGDLRTAKVGISVLGSPEQQDEVMETLQERAFEVQNFLGRELKMRYVPKITFIADHTTEKVLKIERILQELKDERQKSGANPATDPETSRETDQDDE